MWGGGPPPPRGPPPARPPRGGGGRRRAGGGGPPAGLPAGGRGPPPGVRGAPPTKPMPERLPESSRYPNIQYPRRCVRPRRCQPLRPRRSPDDIGSLLGFVSSIRRRVVVLYPKIVFSF